MRRLLLCSDEPNLFNVVARESIPVASDSHQRDVDLLPYLS
jgi:hypothetical protein